MMRKVLSLALALLLLLSCGQALAADQPSDWAQGEVAQAQQLGLVPPALQQRYQEHITRLEFCRLAMQYLEVKTQMSAAQFMENQQIPPLSVFSDCDNPTVLQAAALGITKGQGNNLFAPDAFISREEAATMLHRLNQAIFGRPLATAYGTTWENFNDFYNMSLWARDSITFVLRTTNPASGVPIMQGTAEKIFSPKGAYTIEQSILTMVRMYHAVQYQEHGVLIDGHSTVTLRNLDYDSANYASHTAGQLFANGTGYDLVMLESGGDVVVYQLNENLVPLTRRTIPIELSWAVGVHQNQAGDYFLVFTENNESEAANQEVFRLVRYDASWRRQASTSITGGLIITRFPAYAGNLQMADDGRHLTVLTTRERFVHSDGINHQSNLTLSFDMDSLDLLYHSEPYPDNHVSHSFNQHLLYDGGALVTLEHGDAFPRSLVLHKTNYNLANCRSYTVFDIPGSSGDNYTGVTQGGLSMTDSHYVTAFNTIDQRYHSQMPFERNAILTLFSRSNPQGSATAINLTSFPSGSGKTASAPQLVSLPNGRVAALWEVYTLNAYRQAIYTETQYTVLGSSGELLGPIQSCNQRISAAYPVTFLHGQLLALNPLAYGAENQNRIYINTIDLSMFG